MSPLEGTRPRAGEAPPGAALDELALTGIAGYRNDGPPSVARPLRDLLAAPIVIDDDRTAAQGASLLSAVDDEPEPFA